MRAVGAKPLPFVSDALEPKRLLKGVKRLIAGKKKPKKAPKVADKSNLPTTQVAQTLAEVVELVQDDGAQSILVNGDRAFFAAVKAALPGRTLVWCSTDFADLSAGAIPATSIDHATFGAAIAGGNDLATRYRLTLREMLQANPGAPVHWVGEKFEFFRGTLPAPSDADDVEALVFNHFEQFFGIRDPIQFRIEVYHGAEIKRFWRVLRPSESLLVRASEHFPNPRHPIAISTQVTHPFLTQGRHYRFRVCADVHWRGSFTTLHSAHEFRRDPAARTEFRVAHERVRAAGRLVITVPNYERNLTADTGLECSNGAETVHRARHPAAFVEEAALARPAYAERPYFDCHYKGYGGSFWFAEEEALHPGSGALQGCISGNHHVATPRRNLTNLGITAQEQARFEELRNQGYIVEPHPVPVTHGKGPLRFGFDCDAANPPFRRFVFYWFDAEGKLIAETPYTKEGQGTLFADDLLTLLPADQRASAHLLMFTPDWTANGLRRKGFKMLPDLVVEHGHSGDRDVTEFQSSWRNLGAAIPDFPHWLTPALSIVGRTNVLARARAGEGYRTAVLVANGSGSLAYRTRAHGEILVRNLAGDERRAQFELGPFDWRLIWLDEVIDDLEDFLAPSGIGPLQLLSGDADLNAQAVSVNRNQAVSLQHLWGY